MRSTTRSSASAILLALVASAAFLATAQAAVSAPRPAATTEASRGFKGGDKYGDKYDDKYKYDKECIGGNLDTDGVWTSPCDGMKDKCCPGFQCKLDEPISITVGDYSKYKSGGIVTSNEDAPYTDYTNWNNGNYGQCCVGEDEYDITHLICEPGELTDDDKCRTGDLLVDITGQNSDVRDELACMCCGGKVSFIFSGGMGNRPNRWAGKCNDTGGRTGMCKKPYY